MKILFACVGGMSSSLLASNYHKYLVEKGKTVTYRGIVSEEDLKVVLESTSDVTIAYMHVMAINAENAKKNPDTFDAILIAPQAAYLLSKIKTEFEGIGLKTHHIVKIPGMLYGMTDLEGLDHLVHETVSKK